MMKIHKGKGSKNISKSDEIPCNLHGKSFVHKKGNHTDKQTYHCSLCNKKFHQKSDLRVHIRSHTGEKPYPCNLCHSKFSQISNLYTHKKNIHRLRGISDSYERRKLKKKNQNQCVENVSIKNDVSENELFCWENTSMTEEELSSKEKNVSITDDLTANISVRASNASKQLSRTSIKIS